jgi:serine/threonine protein kinase
VSTPPASSSARAPSRCGPYRLIARIARGLGTTIHVAEFGRSTAAPGGGPGGAQVALKQLASDGAWAASAERRDEFLGDLGRAAWMEHPAIARVIARYLPSGGAHIGSRGNDDGNGAAAAFLVMELLSGLTLDRFIDRVGRCAGPLPSALAAFVVHEITNALAHAQGMPPGRPRNALVHGRLSGRKVMVLRSGEIKLLPFAAFTQTRPPLALRRSPTLFACYRAPEQILGHAVDARADVFAAGALLWELLVGSPAFRGKTEDAAVAAVLTSEVPAPSSLRARVPSSRANGANGSRTGGLAGLDAIVQRALHRDPAHRYATCEQMAQDLARGLPLRQALSDSLARLVGDLDGGGPASPPPDRFEATTPVTSPDDTPGPLTRARPATPPPLPLPPGSRFARPARSVTPKPPLTPGPARNAVSGVITATPTPPPRRATPPARQRSVSASPTPSSSPPSSYSPSPPYPPSPPVPMASAPPALLELTLPVSLVTPPTLPYQRRRQITPGPADAADRRHFTLQPFAIARAAPPASPAPGPGALTRIPALVLQVLLAMVLGFAGGSVFLRARSALVTSAAGSAGLAPQLALPTSAAPQTPTPPAPPPAAVPQPPSATASSASGKVRVEPVRRSIRRRTPRLRAPRPSRSQAAAPGPRRPNPFR